MKLLRLPLLLATIALSALSSAHAQTVQFIIVSKEQYFTQLTNSTASTANDFVFGTSVEGFNQVANNLSGITAPSLTSKPSGTGPLGSMVYNSDEDSWVIESHYGTGAALEGAYGAGNFGVTALSTPLTIALPNETPRFTDIPLVTLSAGTISGGVLVWDPTQALTLTLNSSSLGGAAIDVMNLSVFGTGVTDVQMGFGVSSLTTTIAANTFLGGQDYTVEVSFVNITGGTLPSTISGGPLDGAQYGGIYGRTASFTIQAIPEPSTYAALAGLLALAGVVVRRRCRWAA